jgi:hypothetical protein
VTLKAKKMTQEMRTDDAEDEGRDAEDDDRDTYEVALKTMTLTLEMKT